MPLALVDAIVPPDRRWLVPVLALGVLLKYWLAPLHVRFRFRFPTAGTNLELVRPDAPLPGLVAWELRRAQPALEALGFRPTEPLGDYGAAIPQGLQLFEHPDRGDVATVVVIPQPGGADVQSLVGFTTALRDGGRVCTSNTPLPSVFPGRPGIVVARFAAEKDLARLYALHRAHVGAQASYAAPVRLGDPVGYQQAEEAAARANWVRAGYAYEVDRSLRPTWKGAFCMPYRLLFPWKQWNERRDAALRRRLLPLAGLS